MTLSLIDSLRGRKEPLLIDIDEYGCIVAAEYALAQRPLRSQFSIFGGDTDAVRSGLRASLHPAERERLQTCLGTARDALGVAAFSSAWTAGQSLDVPHAVAEARHDLSTPPR